MSRSGNIVIFPDRSPIEEEAARWIVRLDEGVDSATRAEFEVWKSVQANADAFARLRAHWTELDSLARPLRSEIAPQRPRAMLWGGIGLAAATLIAAGIIGLQPPQRPSAPVASIASASPEVGVYQTAVGAQQRIPLPDGSVVTLNTASQIEVRITGQERSIRLLSGEAYFEVAHDASRPFRVYARDGVTVAVGTAFSVRLVNDAIEVMVSRGKVSFSKVADQVVPVAFVAAGETATFRDKMKLIEADPAQVDRKLSWTEGKLEFQGDPLSSVVADIARYSDVTFEFATPELAARRVGGSFAVGRVDTMLEALEAGPFGVHVERIDETHVRITDVAR